MSGVVVYLANRIGILAGEVKSFLDKNDRYNREFERLLEEAGVRNYTMRTLVSELLEAMEAKKDKPETTVLKAASPFIKTRRARTDEEKMKASERAKQRWAERKAAAKLEVATQPDFDNSRVDTRAIQ